ncbi:MAG TPA: hypothetical protein VK211_16025 [Kamptonema sp.]|nr:hypothetical protein [Kamptonema sp.]
MKLECIDSLLSYSKHDRQAELNKLAPAVKTTISDFAKVSKALSKLIAKSWLKNPEGEKIKQTLLSLPPQELQKYLNSYLKGLGLPTLEQFTITISVTNWNSFYGQITESPTGGSVYSLPYPPQPSFVTDHELLEWLKNENPEDITPVDAGIYYVPLTAC